MRKSISGRLEVELVVKDSQIHGKGTFAITNIARGQVICERLKTRPASEPGTYVLMIGEEIYVEVLGKLKYVNHSSKKPNICFYSDLSVEAIRKIKPGEELTFNYGTNPTFE